MVRDMTTGTPLKRILAFMLPLFLGNLFQQFYSIVDGLIVGRFLGVEAYAGVGATSSMNFLVFGFVSGVCAGICIPVAQDFGAGNHERMRRCIANVIFLGTGVAAALTLLMLLTTGPILRAIGTPGDIFPYAHGYALTLFGGAAASIFYNLMASVLRAVGDSRTPLYFLILSSILNMVLDVIFIVPCGMGVQGAALATVIAQVISAALCLIWIRIRFPILHLKRTDLVLDGKIIGRLAASGVPMGLQFSISAIGSILMQSAINSLGSGAVASVAAGIQVNNLLKTPVEALGLSMATYAGQNYGAKRIDRVRLGVKQAALAGCGYCLIAFGVGALFGKQMAALFIGAGGEEVVRRAGLMVLGNSSCFWVLCILMICRNSLQGLGYSRISMLAGVMELSARAVSAYLLVPAVGFIGVCFANPLAWAAADSVIIPMYFWAARRIEKQLATQRDST